MRLAPAVGLAVATVTVALGSNVFVAFACGAWAWLMAALVVSSV